MSKYFERGIGAVAVIAIIALIAVAGGVYVARNDDTPGEETEEVEEGEESEGEMSGSGSLRALFALGDDLVCTFESTDVQASTRGTVYIADEGERARGDFTTMFEGEEEMDSHFIRNGNTGYFWSSMMEQGFTMTLPEGSPVPEGESTSEESVDFDTNVSYDCEPWDVEESRLEVPADVDFMSFDDLIPAGIDIDAGAVTY